MFDSRHLTFIIKPYHQVITVWTKEPQSERAEVGEFVVNAVPPIKHTAIGPLFTRRGGKWRQPRTFGKASIGLAKSLDDSCLAVTNCDHLGFAAERIDSMGIEEDRSGKKQQKENHHCAYSRYVRFQMCHVTLRGYG